MAMSYYNQIPDVSRDQDRTEKAAQALQQLIQTYPQFEYVPDARYKLQVALDNLAGAQMYVGRYYLEKRQYSAAINRFRQVVGHYQTTRQVEEALERLTEAYFALGITSEAQTAAAVLGHNFPDSPWYKDAYKLLQSNGLEPREDKGSWLAERWKASRASPPFSWCPMLVRLSVRDIVLIDRLDIDFAAGLSALTGETGAGKSILLDAFALALGARGDGSLVRHGAEQGQVTAVFELRATIRRCALRRRRRSRPGMG